MRVCDFIAEKLYEHGVRNIYGLMGGGAAGLNDGFIKNGKLNYVCFHHEQGAGHAAIGEAKYTNKLAVVNPTTGCGGTNCATSVLNAWQDSVPVLFISGNVREQQTARYINSQNIGKFKLRKYGIQEHDVVSMYRDMTKFCHFVQTVKEVPYVLRKAIDEATTGRKGPVWIDIPADIQTAIMSQEDIDAYYTLTSPGPTSYDIKHTREVYDQIVNAKRPLVLVGNGVRLADAAKEFLYFCNTMQLPYVTTFASGITEKSHDLNIGTIGIKGSRAANFAVQNCDLLIVIGCSLNVTHMGYDTVQFAPNARKIIIDIDRNELLAKQLAWLTIRADAKDFLQDFQVHLSRTLDELRLSWLKKCRHWKNIWPLIDQEAIKNDSNGIDIYGLANAFNTHIKADDNFVVDAGQAYYVAPNVFNTGAFPNKRLLISLAQADMGWALPGSIGAALAAPDKNMIAYMGDGSFYSNMQELAVAKYHNLPIKFVVGCNNGYSSIRNTQTKFYEGRVYGESSERGLYFASLESIAATFEMKYYKFDKYDDLMSKEFSNVLHAKEPVIVEVTLKETQDILPAVAILPNGKQGGLHQMYPFLSDEEMQREMIVKL